MKFLKVGGAGEVLCECDAPCAWCEWAYGWQEVPGRQGRNDYGVLSDKVLDPDRRPIVSG
jgi:hypothetical protein